MVRIEAGSIECKKSHQKAAHRKTIPFDAGFYAVWQKSQLAPALYNGGGKKYERRNNVWLGAVPALCSTTSAELRIPKELDVQF